jgi:hypothetical protein
MGDAISIGLADASSNAWDVKFNSYDIAKSIENTLDTTRLFKEI